MIGETPLHIAARIEESRGEKCTKMLLKSGADTNLAMADGRTPLHISAESGTIAVLRQLLSNGADPVRVDNVSPILIRVRRPGPIYEPVLFMPSGPSPGLLNTQSRKAQHTYHGASRVYR